MVPVRKEDEDENEVEDVVGLGWFVVVEEGWSSVVWTKVQLQVGMRSSMMVRRSRHVRTCLWQSTVVTLVAMWVGPMLRYERMVDGGWGMEIEFLCFWCVFCVGMMRALCDNYCI